MTHPSHRTTRARAAVGGLAVLVAVVATGCAADVDVDDSPSSFLMRELGDVQEAFEDEGLGVSDLSSRVGGRPATYEDDGDGWTIVAACRMPSGAMSFGIVPEDAVTSTVRGRALDGGYRQALRLCE
ncbi:hypothetical protein [Aeromicrobium sp. IC_218]|uniref:hypothetical protein n=1 Tax=Aeromicrobium sp. IC_218 TaxID=2545468 RepID=UPI00103FA01E|nr:hypothetical protein [Aeromicrobium sp. IC_218]TCI96973.1 hypothetical protein E0W78_13120 [Aeromicrobium sp. IC_218]